MSNPDRSEILKWAEEHGLKNLEERIATADALERQGHLLLTVLVASIGASLVYGVKAFERNPADAVVYASAWLCGYLVLVAIVFAAKVLTPRAIPAVYSEPEALLEHENASLDALRAGLVDDIQVRITAAIDRNRETARWIKATVFALILAPIVFVLAALYRSDAVSDAKQVSLPPSSSPPASSSR